MDFEYSPWPAWIFLRMLFFPPPSKHMYKLTLRSASLIKALANSWSWSARRHSMAGQR